MRPFNGKLLCCIGLLIGMAVIAGCGSSNGPLDPVGQQYTATIAVQDPFTDNDLSVDIAQDDCDMNATTNDDWEDYGPVSAYVVIEAAEDVPGITIQSYTIQYIALPSPDGTGAVVMPPALTSPPLVGNFGIDVTPGGKAEFSLTCMSVDTKQEYRDAIGWTLYYDSATQWIGWINPSELDEGRYTVRFTFNYVNTEGHTGSIVRDATVWLGDFDDC